MSSPRILGCLVVAIGLAVASPTLAQVSPGGGLPQPTNPGGNQPDKPEGVAEQAPTTPTALPTTPVLPPRRTERAKYKLFELDGYFRWRGDWLKKFDLGFADLPADPDGGGAPFANALGCQVNDPDVPCDGSIKSSNMRLRLEPVISLRENTTQLFMQIDMLDNIVLGETPNYFATDGFAPGNRPLGPFSDGVTVPEQDKNAATDSVRVKRAWAEVETALGRVRFGRMPWHWGLGIFANSGSYDPVHGTYDLDNDHGTTVDRVEFGRAIPGTNLTGSVAMDWSSVLPTSGQTGFFARPDYGQPFDLDDNDDLNQWLFVIQRRDTPSEWNEKVARGEFAWNAGAFLAYRTQKWEQLGVTIGDQPDPTLFVRRNAKSFIPDLWLRLQKDEWDFELEGVGVFGEIKDLADQVDPDTNNPLTEPVKLVQFGGALKGGYRLLDGDIRIGLEVGYASGDSWDNSPEGRTHARFQRILPGEGDTSMNAFSFNPAYNIDTILFRELLGTVRNSTYIRPSFEWDIGSGFRSKAWGIFAFANKPIATPGNDDVWGIELDADIGYESDGFFAGIAYGVLFPLGAMDHPTSAPEDGPGFAYGDNVGDAATAQTIQTRLMLKF